MTSVGTKQSTSTGAKAQLKQGSILCLDLSRSEKFRQQIQLCGEEFVVSYSNSQVVYFPASWTLEQGEQREQLLPQLLARESRP